MEFRFPDWSASLHDRYSQPGAHLARAAAEVQPSAWQHEDLNDLSGDEVSFVTMTRDVAACVSSDRQTHSFLCPLSVPLSWSSLHQCYLQEETSALGEEQASSSGLKSSETCNYPPALRAEPHEARKHYGRSTTLLTDLPDALLRRVLQLQSQRSALQAALACRALRDACLSDELWSAWSGGVPYICTFAVTAACSSWHLVRSLLSYGVLFAVCNSAVTAFCSPQYLVCSVSLL